MMNDNELAQYLAKSGRSVDDRGTLKEFLVLAKDNRPRRYHDDPTRLDLYLHLLSKIDITDDDSKTAAHISAINHTNHILMYYLTFATRDADGGGIGVDINVLDSWGLTPLHYAVRECNVYGARALICSGANRNARAKVKKITDKVELSSPIELVANPEPLSWYYSDNLIEYGDEMIELLLNYYPSENEKLKFLLESKLIVDVYFKNAGRLRYNQDCIDREFENVWKRVYPDVHAALDLGRSKDMELLRVSIPSIASMAMVCYLTSVVIQKSNLDAMRLQEDRCGLESFSSLLNCCFKTLRSNTVCKGGESSPNDDVTSCLNTRTSAGMTMYDLLYNMQNALAFDLIEKLLLVGLNPTPQPKYIHYEYLFTHSRFKNSGPLPPSVLEYALISRVLCLISILNHKFTCLDFEIMYDLMEALLQEDLVYPEMEQAVSLDLSVQDYTSQLKSQWCAAKIEKKTEVGNKKSLRQLKYRRRRALNLLVSAVVSYFIFSIMAPDMKDFLPLMLSLIYAGFRVLLGYLSLFLYAFFYKKYGPIKATAVFATVISLRLTFFGLPTPLPGGWLYQCYLIFLLIVCGLFIFGYAEARYKNREYVKLLSGVVVFVLCFYYFITLCGNPGGWGYPIMFMLITAFYVLMTPFFIMFLSEV